MAQARRTPVARTATGVRSLPMCLIFRAYVGVVVGVGVGVVVGAGGDWAWAMAFSSLCVKESLTFGWASRDP